MERELPKAYLFLHNISKKHSIGNLIRSACAFNISKIFYVSNRPEGSKKMKAINEFHCFGHQGTYNQMEFQSFGNIGEAKKYFEGNKIKICGVEIGEGSKPVQDHPFHGDTAFFMGNEGSGLLPMHRELCDHFVYIPQYTEKTASLNVYVAAGIVFHHFALWANFQEAKVYGEKYQHQE
jgi:tRNA G18 (ribose-2'-O)-methylase SpoU